MRTRRIIKSNDRYRMVWFNSRGKKEDGSADFTDDKMSFDDNLAGVINSLTQRLSVLKNELWYNYSYRMPLIDKNKSKAKINTFILSTIHECPDVVDVLAFKSDIINHDYSCSIQVLTRYGEAVIDL